ncbi:hypothetical protein OHA59_46240 [Streptomyces sp. NBC_01589]|uniref:IclR family transcriptional regulator domain-containing protein n=1 Tax=Streptomyces sp. NBC_01589 TaxID=2975886 RepID=UPI00386D3B10
MVLPAHRTTAGLLLLSELDDAELAEVYSAARYRDRPADRPNIVQLRSELELIGRNGFAVNQERSERGLVALGVPVARTRAATATAPREALDSLRAVL